MNNYLIGDTGLVGKNLLLSNTYTHTFNSSNIHTLSNIYTESSDITLSCLPATKWLVNKNKLQDITNIHNIVRTLSNHKYRNIILISTIDVYLDSPLGVDETFDPIVKNLHYGTHRLLFEKMVADMITYEKLFIIRLPALFGKFLKKNIIFDLLNNNCVSSINSNSLFQWYHLDNLDKDIKQITSSHSGGIFNFFTQPIYTGDIINTFFNSQTTICGDLVKYDWKTQHHDSGYMYSSDAVMSQIEKFLHESRSK